MFRAVVQSAEASNIEDCFPEIVMGDLEMAIINATQTNMPLSKISLCFFHIKKALYRHIQSLGLTNAYNDAYDRSLKLFVHQLAALTYIPSEDVKRVFQDLKRIAPGIAVDFVSYFENTYIGISARGRRAAVAPRYPVDWWNHYESVIDETDTTNNSSEGWHNRFQRLVNKHHPDIYSCLKEIQKEQADVEVCLLELAQGKAIRDAPKKKWVQSKERLRTMVLGYPEFKERGEVIMYLSNIAHTIVLD